MRHLTPTQEQEAIPPFIDYPCQAGNCENCALYGEQFCPRCREEIEGEPVEWSCLTSLFTWSIPVGILLWCVYHAVLGR